MVTLKIAFRNIFRNTPRSLTTRSTIAIGATAVLVFGAYITYIQYGVQTSAIQRTGHLQVFRNGYFNYGTAAPADWGIDDYRDVLRLIREGGFRHAENLRLRREIVNRCGRNCGLIVLEN
jgi:putative ABC transport system permease protein